MGSRRCHGCGGDQIVSRSIQHIEPLGCHRISVADHVHDGSCTALLDTAAGLVLQGGDPALTVSGTGVVINHLIMADKIILKAIDHVHGLFKHRFIDAAVH